MVISLNDPLSFGIFFGLLGAVCAAIIALPIVAHRRELKRDGELQAQTDRALESDPHLTRELERVDQLYAELREGDLSGLTYARKWTCGPPYKSSSAATASCST